MTSQRNLRIAFLALLAAPVLGHAQQRYTGADGRLRVALAKQPFSPAGISVGPTTMANGGVQALLTSMGATVKVDGYFTAASTRISIQRCRTATSR